MGHSSIQVTADIYTHLEIRYNKLRKKKKA